MHLGAGYIFRRGDGHLMDNYEVGLNGEMKHIPMTGDFGFSVDMVDISVATGDTYKRIPTGPYINAVHLADSGVSADQSLQLPIPSKAVGIKDADRSYLIHNKNETYKIQLRDWDGNVFFNVEPGERTYWRLTQEPWGYGEWTSITVPTRHLVFTLAQADLANALSTLKRFDVGTPDEGEARVLPLPSSASGYEFLHDDFFGLGTGAFTDDLAIQSQTAESNVYKVGAIKILGDVSGFAQIDGAIVARRIGGTGDMENPKLRMFLFRNDAVSDYASLALTRIYTSWRDVPQVFVHRGRIQKDDILIPTFYFDDDEELTASDVDLRQYSFEITVEPEIVLEYTP